MHVHFLLYYVSFEHCLTLQACELLFRLKYASDFSAYQILKIICLILILKKIDVRGLLIYIMLE